MKFVNNNDDEEEEEKEEKSSFHLFFILSFKGISFQSLLKAKPPITEDDFKEDFQRQVKHVLCNSAPVSVLVNDNVNE